MISIPLEAAELRLLRYVLLLSSLLCCPYLGAQQGALATNLGTQPQDALPPEIHTGALAALAGLRVQEIQLVNDAPNAAKDLYHLDEQRLLGHLTQKKGEPVDVAKVRTDLRFLFSSGKFEQISLESEKSTNGSIILRYHTLPRYFIGIIYMTGAPRPPSANQLIDTTKLQLGEAFTPAKLTEAVRRIERSLEENGWYQSKISSELKPDADTQQEQIAFTIAKGKQARIGTVLFTGASEYSQGQLRDRAKFHPGDRVTTARLKTAVSRLRKKLQKKDRLEAQITIAQRNYIAANNTVNYVFDIQSGPKIDVRLEGTKLRKSKLKKYIPIYEENAVDDDLLNEGRRNLRDYFQSKGYFDVTVDFDRKQESADRTAVVFNVDKGERHKVVKVDVTGNKYFSTFDLRQRMSIQPADLLLRQGRFSQKDLANDVSAIEYLYQANGFSRVKVTPQINDSYNGKKGDIAVTLAVDEGPQVRVGTLSIQGASAFPEDRIRGLLTDTPGQPYSQFNAATDRDAVVNFYYNQGFPLARFETKATPEPNDPNRVDLIVTIHEGDRVFVDRTLIYGLKYTKRSIVTEQIEMEDGAPLNQSELLDTQRKLYDLTLFNEVDEAVQNPDGAAQYKNVLLHVDEARRYTFNYGLGFEAQTGQANNSACEKVNGKIVNSHCNPNGSVGFSPRVSFAVSRINFRGTDQSITLKTNYGRLQKRALLTYQDPRVFNHPTLTFTANAFYDNSQDVLTFSAKRAEASLQLKEQLTKPTTLIYRYTYRRVSIDAASLNVSPDQVPLLSLPVRLGMPSVTYIRDTRDDPLDSTKGTYNSADFGISATFLGSSCSSSLIAGQDVDINNRCPDPSFSRIFIQNSTYYSFGGAGGSRHWTFARATRVGSESPFGFQGGLVPLAERFYAGGSNSHRGFAINQAGPRDSTTGFPIGGNGEFVNNLELRTPPIVLPFVGDNLSAVFFHDMGGVFDTTGHILPSLFRLHQPDQTTCRTNPLLPCNFNYNSNAVGLGIRYRTPIGPVRFDIGYNLNPALYHRTVLDPNNPNATIFELQHTSRINFFFSIGQAF